MAKLRKVLMEPSKRRRDQRGTVCPSARPRFQWVASARPTTCTPPDGGQDLCRGVIPLVMCHSVSANESGTRAFLSQWAAGMIILDIADPAHPVLLGHGTQPLSDQGNLHSAIAVPGERFAVTTDEDLTGDPPGDPWGAVRIWDISDPHDPAQVGSYATPSSLSMPGGDGHYTAHNPEVHGDLLYVSWYSDGVRVLDLADPTAPQPVAAYVPPAANIWGVHVQGNLIFLSDIECGLYVVEQTDCR